jgi:hypothetical protein
MVGWYEVVGEKTSDRERGTLEVSAQYEHVRRPAWLVLLKLLGVLAMFAVGYGLLLPSLPLPLWQSIAAATGAILIYVGVAFFVRPDPNSDNMGWAGGLVNDPLQYSDNINRTLWNLHCLLGPGRFIAGTFLDAGMLWGIVTPPSAPPSEQVDAETATGSVLDGVTFSPTPAERSEFVPSESDEPVGLSSAQFLDPNRFAD